MNIRKKLECDMFELAYNEHNMYNDVYEMKTSLLEIWIEVEKRNNGLCFMLYKNDIIVQGFKTIEEAKAKAKDILLLVKGVNKKG